MRKTFILFATLFLILDTALFAQTAEEIAKAAYDLPDGKTSSYVAVLTLFDKSGKSRTREIAQFNMKDGTIY